MTDTTDPRTDRPRALHLLEAADALAALDPTSAPLVGVHARGEDIALLRRMADEADPMVGSLARDGFGLDEIAAAPAAPVAAPPTGQAGLRDRIAEALSEARRSGLGGMTEADAVAYMADAVLSALPDTARLHDEILTLRADQAKMRDLLRSENQRADAAIDRETVTEGAEEEQRLALSTALGLGTGAPWDAIRERAAELAGQGGAGDRGVDERDDIQVWPLARVLAEVRCGSRDWTWDEEWADLDRRHTETGYLAKLEQQIAKNGITMPVLIGSDGRLWDGHHRLRIAVRLYIPYVPVEIVPRHLAAETPGPETQGARCRYCPDPMCSEDCPQCGAPIHDLDAAPAVVAEPGKET